MANNQGSNMTDMSQVKLNNTEKNRVVKAISLENNSIINLSPNQKKLLKLANGGVSSGKRMAAESGVNWTPSISTKPFYRATKNGNGIKWNAGIYFKNVKVPLKAMVLRGASEREYVVKYWNGEDFKYF